MRTCFRTALLVAGTSVLHVASAATNLIANGNFESGATTGWTLEVKTDGGANAVRMLDSTSGTAREGKIFHRTNVTAVAADPASDNWHIQLKDPSYPVKAGFNYHLSMWARGDAAHKIQISVYGKSGEYLTSGAPFNLTTGWVQYHMVYNSEVEGANAVNFAIVYGFETGTYDLDDVVITEEVADGNIYSNGGFEIGDAGWTMNINAGDSGQATMAVKPEGAHSGTGYCQISVSKVPTENWMIQLSDGSWTSELDAEYTFSFWAKSNVEGAGVHVAINAGSARNYAYIAGTTYTLGTEWTEYTYMFAVSSDTLVGKDAVNFNIYCGTAIANFDFDDIKLVKTPVSVKRPFVASNRTTPPMHIAITPDRLHFSMSRSGTIGVVAVYDLQGKVFYRKPAGEVVNGSFSLPRPPSGSWIINIATDHASVSKMVVLP